MMPVNDDEEKQLRSVALQNANAILLARQRAERALDEERERLRITLASIGDAVISTDAEGRVTFLNGVAEVLTGWTQAEAAGRTLPDVFHIVNEDTRRPVENPALRALKDGVVVGLANHTVLIARDGIERPIDDSAAPIRNAAGATVGAVLVFRDVTERRRADDARARLATIVDSSEDAIVSKTLDGIIRSWNAGAERLFGYTRDEAVGQPITLIIPAGRIDEERSILERLRRGERIEHFETVRIAKDGRQLDISLTVSPLRDADGRIVGASKIARDITERKQVENALRASEVRATRILESMTEAFITLDRAWRFTYMNAAAERINGQRREDLLGRSYWELFPASIGTAVDVGFRRAMDDRATTEFENNYAPWDRWFAVKAYPAEGGGIAVQYRDVTEAKRAEIALRESEAKFRQLAESIPQLAWMARPDGHIFWYNRRWYEYTGTTLEEMEGWGWEKVHDPAELPKVLDRWKVSIISGEPFDMVFPIRGSDGMFRPFLTRINPLRDDAGRVALWFGTNTDISTQQQAEFALRESEHRFRTLADSVPVHVWMDDEGGRSVHANTPYLEYAGKTHQELVAGSWADILHPDDKDRYRAEYQTAVAGRTEHRAEVRLRRQDGAYRWFQVIGRARFEGDRFVGYVGISLDVTDRKEAREALARSEQRFHQLADAMPQIVWSARPDGDIDYMNRQWHAFTGLPETIGNAGWAQILHPDDSRPAHERWAASVASGAPFEMEMRLRDRRRQAYRWHLIRTVAVRDESGHITRWFGTSTDIHEQKRAAESSRYLAEASAVLAKVVDYESTLQKVANLAVPYFADWSAVDVANDDGSLRRLAVAHQDADKISLAHELMRHYPPDPQSPVGIHAVLRTGKPEIVSEITDELLVQGAKDERQLRLIRSLGLKSYICVPLVVSGDSLGALTFATAESGRQYTDEDLALAMELAHRAAVAIENIRLYQALRETDRRKDIFLATLAHELRNPLAPIRNGLQVLRLADDRNVRERSLDMMDRQLSHMVRLIDDLLDVSRISRNKLELRRGRVLLADVVNNAVETARPLIDAAGHHLEVVLPPGRTLVDADLTRLAQVFSNLLTNSAKYTDPGGRIWLTAESRDDAVSVVVRDTGIGIPAAALPTLFDMFSQVDRSIERSAGGLGIGLALVKGLVEMHGGTVTAESEGPGRGSTFRVKLPAADSGAESSSSDVPSEHPLGPVRRILIVDDNRDSAASMAMMLQLLGNSVRTAHDGVAAVEAAQAFHPQVVLMDIGMPRMNGYEATRQIRQQSWGEDITIIALTGWGQEGDRAQSKQAGCNGHLVKPVSLPDLEKLLGELARGFGACP